MSPLNYTNSKSTTMEIEAQIISKNITLNVVLILNKIVLDQNSGEIHTRAKY